MDWDLNCDLGEGEPMARTKALFRIIGSANVACGGHAGTAKTMETCVLLAAEHGVHLGAHPGIPGSFGRSEATMEMDGLEMLLLHQIGALEAIAAKHRVKVTHVKLHGALYHATEREPKVAKCYVDAMKRWWPGKRIFALAGGRVAATARAVRIAVWEEAFLDRGYRPDGRLIPRTEAEAILSPKLVQRRLEAWKTSKRIGDSTGGWLDISPKTWCVHSDSPGSVAIARLARSFFARRQARGA
jgi:UPF0271 protein